MQYIQSCNYSDFEMLKFGIIWKMWEKKKIFFEVIQGHLPKNQANSRFSRSPFQIRGHSRFSRSGSNPVYIKASSNSACGMKYRWNCKSLHN